MIAKRATQRSVLAAASAVAMVAAAQARAAGSTSPSPEGGVTSTSTSSGSVGTGAGTGGLGPPSEVARAVEEQQRSKEMQQLGDALQRLHADQRNAVDRAAVAARSSDPQVRLYAVRLTTTQEHVDAQLVRSAHDAGLPVSGAAYTAEEQRLQSSLPPPSPDSQFLSGAQTLAQGASQNAGELAQVATSRHQVALVTVAQQAKGSHASSLAQARSLEAAGSSSTGGTGGTSQ